MTNEDTLAHVHEWVAEPNQPGVLREVCACGALRSGVCATPRFEVGKQYTHKDGRTVMFLCVHPEDGAYYIFEDVDGPDEDRPGFFGCEKDQIS